jgi:ABC-type lipoprotein export system ATPase subunit
MKIFEHLNRDERTIITIMHDLEIISNAVRIARVRGGLLVNENMNT